MFNNSDKNWENFGKNDPYYGVLSHDNFHKKNITNSDISDFFESGDTYMLNLFEKINKIFPNFKPQTSLDFGCGVGRLLIPLSKISNLAIGVDISSSMLNEVKKNISDRQINNIQLIISDVNELKKIKNCNFIHSYIVFQHIPTSRGESIFDSLVSILDVGGICACHFTYSKSTLRKAVGDFIRSKIPFGDKFLNLLLCRSINTPSMQMNSYNVNRLFKILSRYNIKDCHLQFTNHDTELGFILIFQKN